MKASIGDMRDTISWGIHIGVLAGVSKRVMNQLDMFGQTPRRRKKTSRKGRKKKGKR